MVHFHNDTGPPKDNLEACSGSGEGAPGWAGYTSALACVTFGTGIPFGSLLIYLLFTCNSECKILFSEVTEAV